MTFVELYESFRDKGKLKSRRVENLGRVIDKENNIFCQKGVTYQYILGEERKEANAIYDIFKEQLKTSNIPQIPVANLNEVMNTFDEYWQNLLFDKMTPDEVCQKAQTAIQEVLDENK